MSTISHCALPFCDVAGADQEPRHFVDRLLRRRQAGARDACAGDRLQPFQAQREMAAAFAGRERMDLVDDHAAHRRQHLAAGDGAEQHVERFGRRHEDVRRQAQRLLALLGRCVAGAHGRPDFHVRQTERGQLRADAGERRFEVEPDVVRQGLQRRDVDDAGLIGQPFGVEASTHQAVERREERRQRLAGTGRRGDQRVAAGVDRRPGGRLRRGRRREGLAEPVRDRRMESFEESRRRRATAPGCAWGWRWRRASG